MKNKIIKILILLLIPILIYLFFFYDLNKLLTLDTLKESKESLKLYFENNMLSTIILFSLIYIITTALSLPGATILTLAGGSLFGLLLGTLIVSFTSTIGATLAFLVSRFLLRDWVQNKFSDKLSTINDGLAKDGAFYLFSLRLIPIFPFFAINLLMGLTPIKAFTFYWVSQIGMLLGTLAYVNAGTQLIKINSLKGILSPGVLISFAILGLLPLILKKLLNFIKARKVLRRFKRPASFDFNLIVIGAGSGGLVSSYIASVLKTKVALIEKNKMGGDCLNTGCVPSKSLISSSKMLSNAKKFKAYGFKNMHLEYEFGDIMERVQEKIKMVEPHDSIERYSKLGVECITGEAQILDPYTVQVNGKKLTTKNIILATGARPFIPNIEGIDKIQYYSSDTIWELRKQPKNFLVLGGGPIGSELALAFSRLGSKVTIIERSSQILTREDEDIVELVHKKFKEEGIKVLTKHEAQRFESNGTEKHLICSCEGEEVKVEFDEVLIALGRKANTKGFGLEELGINLTKRGTVEVNEYLQTNFPNIYACGDLVGPYQFTHFASHQAWYATINALLRPFKKFKADYSVIPWCTYIDPELARVGLNEKEAKIKNIPYEVTTYDVSDLDRAITDETNFGLVKVLTKPGKDKILGATIVASNAGEIITEFVSAMKHGFGLNKILGTIHAYPTMSEMNKYLAGNWKKAKAPLQLLEFVKKYFAWQRT